MSHNRNGGSLHHHKGGSARTTPESTANQSVEAIPEAADTKKPAEVHTQTLAEQLMGAPFSILVTGPKRTGKSQLVDRVFGLSSGDSVASQPVTQIEHFADEEGFIRCVFIGSSGVASYYVRAGGMIEGVVKPPPPFDMAWIFIDGDFGVDEEMCVEATLEKRIPTLICISHADDRQPEDLKAVAAIVKSRVDIILKDLIAQREGDGSLATPAFDVIQVQNPLPPTCMECQSKTLQKRIPDVPTMQAWYCTNPECELCDICPFKATDFVPNQPVFNQELHAKCLGLLHANATVTRRYQIAQLIDSAIKFEYAKTFIITTTLISTGLGASPIPFADAPLLVATQLTLVNSVCSVYGVQNASTYWGLFKNVMATPIVGLAGADILKLIPGVGTVVGGVIDSVICATMAISLGLATVRLCDNLLMERNSRGSGIGEGRPRFEIDAAVGKVFKEIYSSTNEAIKAMFKSGNFSKDSLMGMMDTGGNARHAKGAISIGSDATELENLAFDLVIKERDEAVKYESEHSSIPSMPASISVVNEKSEEAVMEEEAEPRFAIAT